MDDLDDLLGPAPTYGLTGHHSPTDSPADEEGTVTRPYCGATSPMQAERGSVRQRPAGAIALRAP